MRYMHINKKLKVRSHFSFDDTLILLSSILEKPKKHAFVLKKYTKGRVDIDQVYFYRSQVMFGNPYKPVFSGRLYERDGQVFLEGKFTVHIIGKILFTLFTTSVTVMIGYAILSMYIDNSMNFDQLMTLIQVCIVFISAGVFSLLFGSFLANDDVTYLSSKINELLSFGVVNK